VAAPKRSAQVVSRPEFPARVSAGDPAPRNPGRKRVSQGRERAPGAKGPGRTRAERSPGRGSVRVSLDRASGHREPVCLGAPPEDRRAVLHRRGLFGRRGPSRPVREVRHSPRPRRPAPRSSRPAPVPAGSAPASAPRAVDPTFSKLTVTFGPRSGLTLDRGRSTGPRGPRLSMTRPTSTAAEKELK
jgi:hypothetical protein